MTTKKTAIVLFNLGGPDKQKSVKPFLFNLFNDPAIISLPQPFRFLLAKLISRKREKTAQEIYAQIGGKSPILDITKSQAEKLEQELSYDSKNYKTFICMRYWHPMSKEVTQKLTKYQPDQIIFLPLYPQFSTTTTESSFKDFQKALKKAKIDHIPVKKACCYFDNEEFILAHAKLIKNTIQKQLFLNLKDFRILFSAHGLPQKIIDAGDPYSFQVESTAKKVMTKLYELLVKDRVFNLSKEITPENIAKIDHQVCYQSKVGPLKWTTPSLEDELKRVAKDKKSPIITPIAFVSDHSETLVELDIEYKEIAEKLGIEKYGRVPALNIDGHFIKSLASICRSTAKNDHNFSRKRTCPKEFSGCCNAF